MTPNQPAANPLPDSALDSTLSMIGVGSQLGPYKLEGILGTGGMGQVFRGVDTRLGRAVAIKVAHASFSARFEREARAIAALNHPHICTLYDVGPNYLVMELVEGETLSSRLKKGKLPVGQAIEYGAQIADALAAGHARHIAHRDLKPGNVMIGKSGRQGVGFRAGENPCRERLDRGGCGHGHARVYGAGAKGRRGSRYPRRHLRAGTGAVRDRIR